MEIYKKCIQEKAVKIYEVLKVIIACAIFNGGEYLYRFLLEVNTFVNVFDRHNTNFEMCQFPTALFLFILEKN